MNGELLTIAGEKRDTGKDATDMAVDRTVMAADRSLMAWVRTGLSLISFGFTIYKFLQFSVQEMAASGKSLAGVSSPKVVGLFMIGVGILSLLMGILENVQTIKRLRGRYEIHRTRYSLFMAGILIIFGIVVFTGIVFQLKGIG
jgi:putative membrane protein